ncbi:MAG TPA: hypothetical protein DCG78_05325 [Anaerolineaceae bacterium]|nr:MAG: hypothetical protein XD89_0682 [Anaerolineae bacterium 49_20]HAE85913.1 hypothetical protein [Anaerolineaceae bacterium]
MMPNRQTVLKIFLIGTFAPFLLSACGPIYLAAKSATETAQGNSQTKTPTQTATATSIPSTTPTPEVPSLYIDSNLPASFQSALQLEAAGFIPSERENAKARLAFGAEAPISQWVYALVAPFPTVIDGISGSELQAFWQNASPTVFERLIMDQSTYRAILSLWGEPAGTVQVHASADLLNQAWNTPGTWAIVPFEEIQPRWKVIMLDEQSPLHKNFVPEDYLLTVPISLVVDNTELSDELIQSLQATITQTNREADKLATVILTGVTALVRGTAREMEKLGITRPAEVIGPTLREADVLHISNEVPFAVNCGEPAPQNIDKLIFCSKDEYVELLKAVGTDVVELTGDHFEDWGPEAMLHTLELYEEMGWFYYGGGRNLEEAKKPVKLEVNGTKIAFLGCNAKETTYSNATETKPGNFHCDWDDMSAEVEKLKGEGYLPIVTFQHNEYYVWEAQSQLVEDFHRMEAAGAVIVSGSQAHQPHAIEITDNAVLHYGLGNLFFDQYGLTLDTDDAFIDRHVFYDGKYLGVELLTITFRDFSQPLWMDASARAAMLEKLFSVSEWNMPTQ